LVVFLTQEKPPLYCYFFFSSLATIAFRLA